MALTRPDAPLTPQGTPAIDRHAAARAVEDNFVQTWQVIAAAYGGELHDANGLMWHSFQGPNEDPRSTSILRTNLPDDVADAAIGGMLTMLRERHMPAVVVDGARHAPGRYRQAPAGTRAGAVAGLAGHGGGAGRLASAAAAR
jgi:hypothetical protein